MDLAMFEKELIHRKAEKLKKEAERYRKLRLEEKQLEEQRGIKEDELKRHIEQEIERWGDVVCSHLEILWKHYWDKKHILTKPNLADIPKMVDSAMRHGTASCRWEIKDNELGYTIRKNGKFEVTLIIERSESYLFAGFNDVDLYPHKITTVTELEKLLLQAFDNGPLIGYIFDKELEKMYL